MEFVPDKISEYEVATLSFAVGSEVDINDFHAVFNHSAKETLKETAKAMQIKLVGELAACFECSTSAARQKNVQKITLTKETRIAQRIYLDSSSVKITSYGGNKFWVLVVCGYTNKSWSIMVKKKNLQVEPLMNLLRLLLKNGTPVEFIRLYTAADNLAL